MDQLKNLINNLSTTQKITIVAAAAIVCAALYGFVNWRREADFRPLYTGMAPEDAGVVVQKIKEGGSEYRLAENGTTVLVPSARLPEIRLALAAVGLPKSGRVGFELFDKTNFGATEFVEHINYQRALEGELERSVMSIAGVEQARVHLTFAKDSVYLDNQQPAKASVMVRLRTGARIAPQNAMAITQLVASAVEGLSPDAVSLVDMRGTLLGTRKAPAAVEENNEMLEYRRKIEQDLVAKINTTLEPLLGADRFRAGASIECDFSNNEETLETYDPEHSVMLTSQKTEDTTTSAAPFGMPGTASSLPRPAARASTSPSSLSRRTENVTYQTSHTTRHTKVPQGVVKRISVAVLLDQAVRWEGKKKVIVPPSPETLKSIRDVVGGVAAISEARGDQLIVESLPFDATQNQGPPAPPSPPAHNWLEDPISKKVMVGVGILLLLAAGLAVSLFRSVKRSSQVVVESPMALDEGENATADTIALSAEAESSVAGELEMPPALPEIDAPAPVNGEELLQQIRELAARDASAPAGVVRIWLNQGKA